MEEKLREAIAGILDRKLGYDRPPPLGRIIADRPGAVNDKGLARASRVVDRPRPARVLVAKGAADRLALTAIYRLRYWFCLSPAQTVTATSP